MKTPTCIYLDSNIATQAAAVARSRGADAEISVETLPMREGNGHLFVVKTEQSDRQALLDSITAGSRDQPTVEQAAVHCPACHSIFVEYPEHPKNSPTMRAFGRVIEAVGHLFWPASTSRFLCGNCGCKWSVSESRAQSPHSEDKPDPGSQKRHQ